MAESIEVISAGPVNVTVQTVSTSINPVVQNGPSVAVVENGATPQNLFVQEVAPNMATGGIWVQTFDDGDWTLWIEDGT